LKLFKNKSRWRKVTLYTNGLDGADLELLALQVADRLWLKTGAPLYYARYSKPNGESRIEIQIKVDWLREQFWEFITEAANTHIHVEDADGSEAHAQAYLLARQLHGKGDEFTKDVLHWLLNMTGYSYAQEIRLLGEEISAMATNLEESGV
jgi:hypothetical protein